MSTPVFNTIVESALRSIILLVEFYPDTLDLQCMVYLDYMMVHTDDVGGPESLHPPTPKRSGELVVRRELIEHGLHLLILRGLADRIFSSSGIDYQASDHAGSLVSSLTTNYSAHLRNASRWLRTEFGHMNAVELDEFFRMNLDRWAGEFAYAVTEEGDELS